MSHRVTILGCGSSGGVPRIGPMWGACDPKNPKNRRRRCAALIERMTATGRTLALVDTPPDLREQMLEAGVERLDGVLFTHDHADHTHGIDDLRMVAFAMKRRIDAHADAPTLASLRHRFGYCFERSPGSSYRPILDARLIEPGRTVSLGANGEIEVMPIAQAHGDISSLGFRVGALAYSPDVSDIPEASIRFFRDLDVWIVDALRFTPHPSHFHVRRALEWIERVGAKRAILTHMTSDLDYDALRRELPAHVEPAYDGMTIEID